MAYTSYYSTTNSSKEEKLLLDAAFEGNLQLVQRMALELARGYGPQTAAAFSSESVKDDDGRTALHLAALGGRIRVCQFLIDELQFDVNLKDAHGTPPLHYAALEAHLETAIYLLDKGANPAAIDDTNLTALHFAAQKGMLKLIRLLISKGAVVDAEAECGTPLRLAAGFVKKEAVKILLEKNANPTCVRHGISAMTASYLAGSSECARLLLEAGADPNADTLGPTPLEIAVSKGETEMIISLLEAGADPNVTDNHGLTPLECAALKRHYQDVSILFPVTSQIPSIPDWSVDGIISYVRSQEVKGKVKQQLKEHILVLKSKGDDAFKNQDYFTAISCYSEALVTEIDPPDVKDPPDAILLSNRSMCWARLDQGLRALVDAQNCLSLRPNWSKAHYREGVAWNLLGNYHEARSSFLNALQLDPENEELKTVLGKLDEANRGF